MNRLTGDADRRPETLSEPQAKLAEGGRWTGSGRCGLFEGFRFDRAAGCLSQPTAPVWRNRSRWVREHSVCLRCSPNGKGSWCRKTRSSRPSVPETVVEDANLTVQISALRRVLDRDRAQGSCIQTIPSRGYRFIPAVTQVEGDGLRRRGARLSGVRRPAGRHDPIRRLAAILAADVAGYSRLMGEDEREPTSGSKATFGNWSTQRSPSTAGAL